METVNSVSREKTGEVSPDERDEILLIYGHITGIEDLLKIVTPDNNPHLYERLTADMEQTVQRYKGWWNKVSAKYRWQSKPGARWEINFETCDIYLVVFNENKEERI